MCHFHCVRISTSFELGITQQLGMRLPHFDSDLFSSTLLSSRPSKEAAAFMPVPSSCDQHTDTEGGETSLAKLPSVHGGVAVWGREERLAKGDEVAIIREVRGGPRLYATTIAAAAAAAAM